MKLRIFTDGACSQNPGPGGWAALFALEEKSVILSGHEIQTTNNRMELLAVIRCLEKVLKKYTSYKEIEIHSDSAYVVNANAKNWLQKWKLNNWQTASLDEVKNSDLWKCLDDLLIELKKKKVKVSFVKVKGHNGVLFNEIVDLRARDESIIAKKKAEDMKDGNVL